MKNGKNTMIVIIGFMCFVLIYTISMQFKTVQETDVTSIKTMREEELREELSIWKNKYEETDEKLQDTIFKINEYKEKSTNNQEASELLDKELNQSRLLLGKVDVQGEGVEIILKDGSVDVKSADILKLINELKLAEAEAISINDERIINLTEIAEVDSYIIVNGQRLTSPFTIKVIGNQKYLESGLTAKGGYIDTTNNSGKNVVVTAQKNLKILKYNRDLNLKHININK